MWAFLAELWYRFLSIFRRGESGGIEEITGSDSLDPGRYICYYGCPASKKAEKLQLGKKTL